MDSEHYRKRELQTKYLSIFVATIGALGVIISVITGLQSQTDAINNQWNQKFYEEKIALYIRATELAGRIANLKENDMNVKRILQATIVDFRSLYWGPMAIVEKPDVEAAMVNFNKGLKMDISVGKLKQLALYLSHVCKNEVNAEFNTDIKQSRYGDNEDLLKRMREILGIKKEEPKFESRG